MVVSLPDLVPQRLAYQRCLHHTPWKIIGGNASATSIPRLPKRFPRNSGLPWGIVPRFWRILVGNRDFWFSGSGGARAHRRRLVQGHEQGQIQISPVRTGTLTLEGLVLPTVKETILPHCLEHHLSPLVDKPFLSLPFFIRDC